MSDPDLNLEFCCTCLKVGTIGDKFVSLGFVPPEDISYKNKLKSCVPEMGLENTNDCFLCKPCSAALETAYTFRCMCLKTETRLEEFRTTHIKNAGLADKTVKQELLDSYAVDDSVKSRKTYSTGPKEIFPTGAAAATISTQPEGFSSQPKVLYPTTSQKSEEVCPPDFFTESVERDSKIEIVKDELGSLLTESLGSAIDINIHIFDQHSSRKINSKADIFNSLDAEIEEIEKNSYSELTITRTKRLSGESLPQGNKQKLSDAEIVEISCKTIPALHKCLPESLDCQVTLEKIQVSESPVKTPSPKRTWSKGRAFWCAVCRKDVYRKERFHAHVLRHSNIRAYKCNFCKQGFFSGESLKKHEKSCVLNGDFSSGSGATEGNVPEVSSATSPPKIPKRKYVRKAANLIKIRKIPSASRIRKKTPIAIEESENSDTLSKTKTETGAARTGNKPRKSTRQQTPKKLCNMDDNIFRCKQCSYQSYYKQKYQVHLLHHANDKPFPCPECPKKFYERWELNRHLRTAHSQNKTAPNKPITKDPNPSQNRPHGWAPKLLPLLEPAISLVVNPGTVVTPIIQSIHSLAEDDPIEMSFSCKKCNISFKSRNLLMLHTQTHNLKRTCQVCQEAFVTEADFLSHAHTHEASMSANDVQLELAPKIPKRKKRKKFFCNVCNMEFASRDHGNIHTGAKPYRCKVCDKQFAAYTTLRKHSRTHLDRPSNSTRKGKRQVSAQRKTFACEICKKKFAKKEHVYSHNCQNASGDAVYRCQICKNAFIGRAALIEHMGIHVSQNENVTE